MLGQKFVLHIATLKIIKTMLFSQEYTNKVMGQNR